MTGLGWKALPVDLGCRDMVRGNDQYEGGYITRHYGRPRKVLHALQIEEIARGLYMDEEAGSNGLEASSRCAARR